MRPFKKYITLLLVILGTMTLTGCDLKLSSQATSELKSTLTARITANQEMITNLANSGLITPLEAEEINKSIENIGNDILDKISSESIDSTAAKLLLRACTGYSNIAAGTTGPEGGDSGHDGFFWDWVYDDNGNKDEKLAYDSTDFITNSIDAKISNVEIPALKNGLAVHPIKLIDDVTANTINERMTYPIYVLQKKDSIDISQLSAWINQYVNTETGTVNSEFFTTAGNFFEPLKDAETGEQLSLLDLSTAENMQKNALIQPSRAADGAIKFCSDPVYDPNLKTWNYGKGEINQKKLNHQWGLNRDSNDPFKDTGITLLTKPGTDLSIVREKTVEMQLRLVEVNQDAYNNIIKTLGLGTDQYLIVSDGNKSALYLMQYPVGYIDGFELSDDKSTFDSKIKKSNLNINIKTGKLYKTAYNGTTFEVNNEDPYIWLNAQALNTSSFILNGSTGYDPAATNDEYGAWNLKLSEHVKSVGAEHFIDLPRFVLRDYLELAYSPDVVDGEKIVAYGRMIRILNLNGKVNETMAVYRPRNGDTSKIDGLNKLFISDFSDTASALSKTPYDAHLPNSPNLSIVEKGSQEDKDFQSKLSGGGDITKMEDMKSLCIDFIKPTLRFPSTTLDSKDNALAISSDLPLMYGMLVNTSMVTSGLVNWISSDSKEESLTWWIEWLSTHNFTYMIDSSVIADYLTNSYLYSLEDNLIILNLDTIQKINQELTSENNTQRTRTGRTLFIVSGYLLVAYSILLLMCWATDIGVDLGFNLLNKASFGKFTAISSEEEIPNISTKNQKTTYVGFQTIFISCLKIMAVGIVLMYIDIVNIVIILVHAMGGIAKMIGAIIGGVT